MFAQFSATLSDLSLVKEHFCPSLQEQRSGSSLTQSLLRDVLAFSFAALLICFNNSTLGRSDNIILGLILPLLY